MDVDFRTLFQTPRSHCPPKDTELAGSTQYPNLNSIEFRHLESDLNSVQSSPFHEIIESNNDESFVFLATSSYTGRLWTGSLFGYENFDDVGKPAKEKLKHSIDSNIKGLRFIAEQMILLTTSNGSIQLCSTQSAVRNENGYNLYLVSKKTEHIGIIEAFDVFNNGNAKNKAVTGSTDGCIKVWNIGPCDLLSEKTYEYAHSAAIKTISSKPNSDALFASCSADQRLAIWDIRSRTPIVAHCTNPTVANSACSWERTNGAERLYLGDISGNVNIYDPRKLDAILSTQRLFDRPIFKFKSNANSTSICVLANSPTIKVLSSDKDKGLLYENSTATDYVRDIHWLKENNSAQQSFYSVGWSSGVHKHSF